MSRLRPLIDSPRFASRLAFALVCLFGVLWVGQWIGDETRISMDGDMPRYLLNGVFLRDALTDFPIQAPFEYAYRYYARYPALSLGHHPLLPAMAEAPFFLVFGVSIFSARLGSLVVFVATIWFWFHFIRDVYGVPTAVFASLLLISTPGFVPLYQVALSEPYALCLVLGAVYFMQRYTRTERLVYLVAFAVFAVASTYAKQLALVALPVYAFQFLGAFGIRRIFTARFLILAGIAALVMVPLLLITLKYSAFNVAMMLGAPDRLGGRLSSWNLVRFIHRLVEGQFVLTIALLVTAGVGVLGAILRRDRRVWVFAAWIVGVYAMLVGIGMANDRFVCYWLPPFAALGASLFDLGPTWRWRTVIGLLLSAVVIYQTVVSVRAQADTSLASVVGPVKAAGYEDAARVVTREPVGTAVLYSASVDTGYFVFFVRKHDPDKQMIVLRADKLLTTSRLQRLDFKRRINSPDELVPLLQRYGIGYVVLEDTQYPEGPLQWLQTAVTSPDFTLKERIPIQSTEKRLRDRSISVYVFNRRTPPDPHAQLSLDIPLMDDQIGLEYADLLETARN